MVYKKKRRNLKIRQAYQSRTRYGICVYGNRRRGGQYTVRDTTIFFSFFSISLSASRSANLRASHFPFLINLLDLTKAFLQLDNDTI